jgi:murein DD-endopeptidase MepM/ murein hydrolase activator NlpD
MTVLGATRLGWLAWSWRRQLLVLILALLLLPLVMAAMVIEAAQGPGRLTAPVQHATLTQPFGCTGLAIEPWSQDCPSHHFHSGIDLAGPIDSPVFAARAGSVLVLRQRGGYGLYMVVTHDPRVSTLYAHLDLPLAQTGDWVTEGQQIALMGSSGSSTGPHLHFEVRIAGLPVDPLPLLPGLQGGDR